MTHRDSAVDGPQTDDGFSNGNRTAETDEESTSGFEGGIPFIVVGVAVLLGLIVLYMVGGIYVKSTFDEDDPCQEEPGLEIGNLLEQPVVVTVIVKTPPRASTSEQSLVYKRTVHLEAYEQRKGDIPETVLRGVFNGTREGKTFKIDVRAQSENRSLRKSVPVGPDYYAVSIYSREITIGTYC